MNNTVKLIGYYSSDEKIASSAWCSTSTETQKNLHRIPDLLKTLAENGHESPFEKSFFHFLITTDIATHIQLLKHRIGVSINAESARYKEIKDDEYYIPNDFPEEWKHKLEEYTKEGLKLYHECCNELTPILGRNRAKESSRFFRSYNTQINADISFNWRSFLHFYKLRSTKDAQKEIKEISETMLELIKNIDGNPFEYTIKAFCL
jgi:flavin-dependent thymidylate synthase